MSRLLGRAKDTYSTYGPGPSESRSFGPSITNNGKSDLKTLNPSKDASAFTQSYSIERETKSSGVSGTSSEDEAKYNVVPITKVEVVPSDSSSNPKHVYVNISAQNVLTSTGIPAQFQIDFDQPFLKNSEKYYLTIAKAQFPTISIPLFTFNLNSYRVTIAYNNNFYSSFLRPANIIPLGSNYYVNYYQQFLDSFNTAVLQTFNQIIATDSTFTGTIPPYIVYDKPSNRFSIIAQQNVWYSDIRSTGGQTGAVLYVDYQTYRLFNSLPAINEPSVAGGSTAFLLENCGGRGTSYIPDGINPLFSEDMNQIVDGRFDPLISYQRGTVTEYLGNNYGAIIPSLGAVPATSPLSWQLQGASTNNPGIWSAGITYVISQIVYYPTINSVPFVSLAYPNLANTPVPGTTTAFWKPLNCGLPTTWLFTSTYEIGQNVYYPQVGPSGVIYTSRTAGNTGHNPSTDTTNWIPATQFNSYDIIGEYSSLSAWSDIESIVIQTGTLPIRYEIFAPPQSDIPSIASSTSGSQVPRPVLTDLDLIKSENGFDRSPVQYIPNGPYRMIDMFARDELKRIDSFIQYKHKDLTFTDLILLPGDYFAIKYLFIRNDALTVT